MYFSRVRMEPSKTVRSLIHLLEDDVYTSHKLIWKLFPDDPTTRRKFVYRREYEKEQMPFGQLQRGMPIFYVVSEKRPVSVEGLMTVEVKSYNPQLTVSMRLGFDLRVNPVVARVVRGKKNSAKHDVLMDAKRKAKQDGLTAPHETNTVMKQAAIDWFAEREEKNGFRLTDASMVEVSSYRHHHIRNKNSRVITFSSVNLVGSLEVINVELFRSLLFQGIGSSRSFGCGMMLVRRM